MSAAASSSFFVRVCFWRRFRRALLVLFVPLMVAGGAPTLATIIYNFSDISFSPRNLTKDIPARPQPTPDTTNVEQPRPTLDVTPTPAAADIAKAWDAAQKSDDIAELFNFVKKYPDTAYADEAWSRMNNLVNSGDLKLASLSDDSEFIGQVLGHKENAPAILNKIADDHDLEHKYPFGYAIFYSDGKKTVNSGVSNQRGIVTFDPSSLNITFRDNKVICVELLSVSVNGRPRVMFSNMCFGGNGSMMRLINVERSIELDAEPLGQSQLGLAWVVGLRGL